MASAGENLAADRYSACGLASVHAAISAADAVTAHVGSVVSAAQNHLEVVQLIDDVLAGRLPAANRRQLIGLLRTKSEVEYSQRAVSPGQARLMVDQATRFVAWSRRVVSAGQDPLDC